MPLALTNKQTFLICITVISQNLYLLLVKFCFKTLSEFSNKIMQSTAKLLLQSFTEPSEFSWNSVSVETMGFSFLTKIFRVEQPWNWQISSYVVCITFAHYCIFGYLWQAAYWRGALIRERMLITFECDTALNNNRH